MTFFVAGTGALVRYGPNDPSPRHTRSQVLQVLAFFVNPLVIILLIAAAASGFLGQIVDAAIIVTMVLVSVAINFVQTWQSEAAAANLRSHVALPPRRCGMERGRKCTAWRSFPATWFSFPAAYLGLVERAKGFVFRRSVARQMLRQ